MSIIDQIKWKTGIAALAAVAVLGAGSRIFAANPDGPLRIELVTAYNYIVDSNVETPATYAPRAAYIEARIWNDGATDLTGVTAYVGDYSAGTPGVYPSRAHPGLTGPLPGSEFAITHEGGTLGTADATRYLGTIPAGGYVAVYWLVSYPNLDENGDTVTGGVNPADDLYLYYDVWATADDGGTPRAADVTRKVTMRNCISAMANKIFPNTAGKVPDVYQELLQKYAPEWNFTPVDGSTGTKIMTEGIWYDLGNVGQGFDNDGDLVPDQNAWMQPVGDPDLFDAGSFRLAKTYALIVVKLKDGGELVIEAQDQLYFTNLPDNTGVIGLIRYDFLVLQSGATSQTTPYQMAASGFENEKFNGDYGATLGEGLSSQPSALTLDKTGDAFAAPGGQIDYSIAFANAGSVAVGDPLTNNPLVIRDSIPAGTVYVAFTADTGNTLPSGVSSYTVLYTTDGTVWLDEEPSPAGGVTEIEWWLSDALAPAASGVVTFSVAVDDPAAGPLVNNYAGLSFGATASFMTDTALTLISGINRLGDTVFRDNGVYEYYGNWVQDTGETGIEGMTVTLYYDANSDGFVDSGDFVIGTEVTDSSGWYQFSDLFDGDYLAVVSSSDPSLPAGYSPTSPTVHAADLDSGMADPNPVVYLDADFGFAPALVLDKSMVGSSPVYEGDEIAYRITVSNEFPGFGDQTGGALTYTNYATARDTAKDAATGWSSQSNALLAPDSLWAIGTVSSVKDQFGVTGFTGGGVGSITAANVLIRAKHSNPLAKNFYLRAYMWFPGASSGTLFATYTSGSLPNGYDGTLTVNVTGLTSWTWQTLANSTIQLETQKDGGSGGNVISIDSIGFHLTTSIVYPPATDGTILYPVPLQDVYDASLMTFVSAVPSQTSFSVESGVGMIDWDNVGPIYPGGESTVTVYFTALEPPGNDFTTLTNAALVEWATFSNGVPANDGYDEVVVDLYSTGSIGDFVWRDLDGDGVQDGGYEAGIAGVTVQLTPPAGVDLGNGPGVAVTTVTDSSGYYLFDGIPSTGSYTVAVLTATLPGGAGTNTYDEDGGTATPNNQTVVVLGLDGDGPADHLTADFGYNNLTSLIRGTVWNDADRDGASAPETGEPLLAGVTIQLYNSSMVLIASTTTAANGTFSFQSSFNGDYTVRVVTGTGDMSSGDWTASFDSDGLGSLDQVTVTVPLGGLGVADFSYYETGDYGIGDTLFYDWDGDGTQDANDEGIAGVSVSLYGDSNSNDVYDPGVDPLIAADTTAPDGTYLFENLPPGDYIVIVDHNSAGFPDGYTITADPQGALDGRSAVTIVAADDLAQDFGYQPTGSGAIGDTVWRDLNGDGIQSGFGEIGIPNITVTLLADLNGDSTYVTVAVTSTDANGNYLFSDLPDGDYRVVVDVADADLPTDAFGYVWSPSTPAYHDVTISGGNTDLTADFGFDPLGAIGDTIFWDANETGTQDLFEGGVEGALVELYQDVDADGYFSEGTDVLFSTATTSADGKYIFTGLPEGDYVVFVAQTGVLATPILSADPENDGLPCSDPESVGCDGETGVSMIIGQNFMGADFGYLPPGGTLGGTVWVDFDDDGIVDAGEVRIPYATVELWSGGALVASTLTDENGDYLFYGLDDGTYQVVVRTDLDFPDGLTQTVDPDGTLDDQAEDVVMSGAAVVTIGGDAWTAGDLEINFGYRYSGDNTLSGTIGLDGTVPDGVMGSGTSGVDADELAFPGVTVYAYLWDDANSDGIVDSGEAAMLGSTSTDANGDYGFSGLPEGEAGYYYIVSMTPPSGGLELTTTADDTPAAILVEKTDAQGYTTGAYQAVPVAQDITDMDFAFLSSILYDYGDLPASYGTLFPYGARHSVAVAPELYLGATVTTEINGQPSAQADGDGGDDGVAKTGFWRETSGGGSVEVTVGAGEGWLVGFVDFNRDGVFTGSGEMVIDQAVSSTGGPGSDGVYEITFDIPEGSLFTTQTTVLYARFRVFPTAPLFPELSYSGSAISSEVEDYLWEVGPTPVKMVDFSAAGFDGLVAVEWETGAEIDNLGFRVHRSEGEEGPYEPVSGLILGLLSNPMGGRYLFIDRNVENGKVYHYRLEAVDTGGRSEWYGPIAARAGEMTEEFSYDPSDYISVSESISPRPTGTATPFSSPAPWRPTPIPASPSPADSASTPGPSPAPSPTAGGSRPIIPDFADYDGDGISDIAVFRGSSGLWAVRNVTRVYFGSSPDLPVPGDYDGDGTTELAVFRGGAGLWAVRGVTRAYFGSSADVPVPGD